MTTSRPLGHAPHAPVLVLALGSLIVCANLVPRAAWAQGTEGGSVQQPAPPAAAAPPAPAPAAPAAEVLPVRAAPAPAGYAVTVAPVAPGAAWPVVFVPAGYVEPMDPTRRALNAVYFELGGNAIIYSINYERFLTQDISARIGVGYLSLGESLPDDGATAALTSVPVMINYLGVGQFNHRLELGAGFVALHVSARAGAGFGSSFGSGLLAAGTASVAYRYAPLNGGFTFKAGFTPLISSFGVYPTFGLSLGALF